MDTVETPFVSIWLWDESKKLTEMLCEHTRDLERKKERKIKRKRVDMREWERAKNLSHIHKSSFL
jgi:hypothetical protein